MKKLVMIGIFLTGMTGFAQADVNSDVNKIITTVGEAPAKLQLHIQDEIAKAKEFQKQKWAESKIQFANLKKLFIRQ